MARIKVRGRGHVGIGRAAEKLFEDFTGQPADRVAVLDVPNLREGEQLVMVGTVVAIAYEAVRDGQRDHYEHAFRKSSRPVLAASSDGKRLYLLAGAYEFTDHGIEDR